MECGATSERQSVPEPAAEPSLRCGVFVVAGKHPGQDDGQALQRSVDVVVAAEAAGFDSAWVAEHHFMSYGVCPSGVTFAAHLLGRTKRIKVGTAISVLSTAHPVALAEQTLLLDQLSGGRFHLGVGRGGPWVELEVFGTGLDRYERGLPASLDLLLRCLSQERVSAGEDGEPADPGGREFSFREVALVPRPRTQPRPSVTLACSSPVSIELAAEHRLPMLLGMDLGDQEKVDMMAHYGKASRGGRSEGKIDHMWAAVAHVADSDRQAQKELRHTLPVWLGPGLAGYVPVDARRRTRRDPHRYAGRLCDIHPVGSAATCVERLRASAAATGIRNVILLVEGVGDHARTLENVSRLGAEVLPRL